MAITEVFTYATINGTPEVVWLILALASVALFICAFSIRMRDESGDVSPTRIIFSIFGVVVCSVSAYASLVIDVTTGQQTHALYQGYLMVIIFVILGGILFANFIYSIIAPEITTPDKKDYSAPIDAKTKAEK